MKDIKDRLRELRDMNNLSKVEMAQKLSINKSSITRYESGEIKPTLDIMIKISHAFNVSLDWLAGFDTEKELEYEKLVKECMNSGISSEKLKKAIDLLKE